MSVTIAGTRQTDAIGLLLNAELQEVTPELVLGEELETTIPKALDHERGLLAEVRRRGRNLPHPRLRAIVALLVSTPTPAVGFQLLAQQFGLPGIERDELKAELLIQLQNVALYLAKVDLPARRRLPQLRMSASIVVSVV